MDWLEQHNKAYQFYNFKKEGVSKELLQHWSSQVPWQTLLNKKGTTWRGFTEAQQTAAGTKAGALKLMAAHPSVIKRPVLQKGETVIAIGFDALEYAEKTKG